MPQLLRIRRHYENDVIDIEQVLDTFKQSHSVWRTAAIKLIHQNEQRLLVFRFERCHELGHLLLKFKNGLLPKPKLL